MEKSMACVVATHVYIVTSMRVLGVATGGVLGVATPEQPSALSSPDTNEVASAAPTN